MDILACNFYLGGYNALLGGAVNGQSLTLQLGKSNLGAEKETRDEGDLAWTKQEQEKTGGKEIKEMALETYTLVRVLLG